MVLYPPICDEAWNGGGDVQGCNTPEEVAEHSNHAIHSCALRMSAPSPINACSFAKHYLWKLLCV
jgi:hypothetical protein